MTEVAAETYSVVENLKPRVSKVREISDSDDSDGFDLIDVDEAPQLSRNTKGKLVVSVPAMTLWSGVRAASEVDYSRWVKALHGGGRAATSAGGEVLLSCCTLWRQLASVDPAALETLLE